MSSLIIPKKLTKNSQVAIISHSWAGASEFPDRFAIGRKQLEEAFGVQTICMPNTQVSQEANYHNPQLRADDLHQALQDPEITAIISTIGGEDAIRTLPYIDLEIIKNNPKIFMGYSDATIVHFMFYTAWIQSYYWPSIMAGLAENGWIFSYTRQSVSETIFKNKKTIEITGNTSWWTNEFLDWANPENQNIKRKLQPSTGWKIRQKNHNTYFEGKLLGGCLDVFYFLWETHLWPDIQEWEGKIVFIEISEEEIPFHIFKRIIRSLGIQWILSRISGILFGRCPKNNEKYNEALLEVIRKEFWLYNLPIISDMDFGHTDPMFVLPYWANARFDFEQKKLFIYNS